MDRSLYCRPNKPKFIDVKRRARDFAPSGATPAPVELLAVDRATECHVTPAATASLMVDYLNLVDGLSVLEPECGTGNLIAAVIESGYTVKLQGVERHYDLHKTCGRRFAQNDIALHHGCFLEFAQSSNQKFDRIVMNPPFRAAKQHIEAALKLLALDGEMVALVPTTFSHPKAETLQILERGLFASTDVHTKLIAFYH